MAASAEPVAPSPRGLLADHFKHLEVATYTIVLVIAAQFRTEGPILLLQWRMAVLPTPWPDCSHTPAQTFPDRLALDDPVSTACLGPRVGKSQQVEWPHAPCRGVSARWLLERHHCRLCGMNGQTKAIEPLRQDGHQPACVGFQLAADDPIIGPTRPKAPALHPGSDILDKPRIQDMMQEYMRHHGRNHPALRRALVRVRELFRLPHAGVQPLADASQYPPIIDPLRATLPQVVPVELVEKSTDIRIDYPVSVLPALPRYLVSRLLLCIPFLRKARVKGGRFLATPGVFPSTVGPPQPDCTPGDHWLSHVPESPLCLHAPLSDPGGVLHTRLVASRTAAFRPLHAVGFPSRRP